MTTATFSSSWSYEHPPSKKQIRLKKKSTALIFTIFLGSFGLQWYYLGKIGRGVLYSVFSWTGIPFLLSIVDFIRFIRMDSETFDNTYNQADTLVKKRHRRKSRQNSRSNRGQSKLQTLKKAGKEAFQEYDFEEADRIFQEALGLAPNDKALHFNLACVNAHTENAAQAFYHLQKAVELGFKDTTRIEEHPALAFLRVQPEFEAFRSNGYKMSDTINTNTDLLDQLERLSDLKERGVISDLEFQAQKVRLLNKK